jgi:hypothetical protein
MEAAALKGRVVVMGFTRIRWHRLLDPDCRLLVKLRPGDAYSDPWRDLAAYGAIATGHFLASFYYVSSVTKPEQS